jgi:hypothetical protein
MIWIIPDLNQYSLNDSFNMQTIIDTQDLSQYYYMPWIIQNWLMTTMTIIGYGTIYKGIRAFLWSLGETHVNVTTIYAN